ncbi:MAG TPA: hypothetical protein VEK79_02770 [Thermoanaerobaculia bacterium]|nr:hypothetical protein [Thermoanaerobaculia bacterium]
MHIRTSRAVLLSFLSLAASALFAQSIDAPFELRRGVIVDGARGAVYLPQTDGEIEAVDLSAGRVLWTFPDAALPLTVDGSLLVAQGEEMRKGRLPIAVLDLQAGGKKVVDAVIPLPDDVHALIVDDFERSFRATAEREGDSFVISWTYTERVVQGIWRAPDEPLPTRTVSGAARINIATGAVLAAATRPAKPRTEATAERVRALYTLAQTPWRAGNVLAMIQGGRGGPLTLKRWDASTSAALADRVLVQKAVVALPSAEEKYLLASERVGEGGPDDPEYRWSIFSLETGERIGEMRRDVSAAPFVVWKDSVVFESRPYGYRIGEVWVDEPLKIRALRLSRGVPVWDRTVRHLEYRGPVPPVR